MSGHREGLKSHKNFIKGGKSRTNSVSENAKSSSSTKTMKTELDYNFPLSELTWNFEWEEHSRGIIHESVSKVAAEKFAEWTDDVAAGTRQGPLEPFDITDKHKATLFLFKNPDLVTVADIIKICDPSQKMYSGIMSAVNTRTYGDFEDQVNKLAAQLRQFELAQVQATQMASQQKDYHEKMIEDLKAKVNKKDIEFQQLSSQHTQLQNNVSQQQAQVPLQQPQNQQNQQPLFEFGQSSSSNVNSTPQGLDSMMQMLAGLTQAISGITQNQNQLATNLANLDPKGPSNSRTPKIGANRPPKFQLGGPNCHRSLRLYSINEFSRWARDQSLSQKQSTLYLCHAFTGKEQIDTVDFLAQNVDGSAKFELVSELVDQIIKDLCLNEETERELRKAYDNYKFFKNLSYERNFKWVSEQRRLGWPNESAEDRLIDAKRVFALEIPQGEQFGLILHFEMKFDSKWADCASDYQCATLLRELESRFKKNPQSSVYLSNQKTPTNTTTNMDISNFHQTSNNNMGQQFYTNPENTTNSQENNNMGTKTKAYASSGQPTKSFPSSNRSHKKDVNALAERECPTCKKKFMPARPQFWCCTSKCARERPPRNPSRDMNNFDQVNGAQNGDQNVSTNHFFITPVHVYTPDGGEIPVVIHDAKFDNRSIVKNALFDTGAGPTLVTTGTLKLLNMCHLIIKQPSDDIRAGDKRPMKGSIGHIQLKICIEDSSASFTDPFMITFQVFDDLNHNMIVGRDSMKKSLRKFEVYPQLDVILFNPSIKTTRTWNNKAKLHSRLNNICDSSVEKLPEQALSVSTAAATVDTDTNLIEVEVINEPSKQKPENIFKRPIIKNKFIENDTILLNVPLTTFNRNNFKRYSRILDLCCNNFCTKTEEESVLEEVLTSGGLDGLIDKNDIQSENTKTITTDKGELKVGHQISPDMEKRFIKYVNDYSGNIFDTETLGKTKQTCHPEFKSDAKPFSNIPKYMPLNPHLQNEAKKLVDKMVKLGVITETTESANSTIFIVQKSGGRWRLICDLRQYNDRCQDFVVHLPSPYELINRICQFQLFSYVDFPEAYFNVPLSEDSIKNHPIVASVSGCQKNYKYLRMAQGLKVASSNFVSILNQIYATIMEWCFNYLDDSVLCSKDDENIHFERVKQFIDITEKAGLKLSLRKCVFFTKNLTFLNYTVTNGSWGISENQRNTINALNSDNLTKDKRESLAAFLNYFNRFHTGVSFAARKIRDVTTSPDSVKSILENIKKRLINSPALRCVNFKEDLHIFTDASKYDCSGVVLQKTKHGYEMVTCFSKKFPANMVEKDIYTKELWTLQQFSRSYRYLFIGNHKKIFHCDSRAVLAAKNSKAPSLNVLFSDIKCTFGNVEFKYVDTKKNASDCFTRQEINNFGMARLCSNNIINTRPSRARVSKPLIEKIMKCHRNAQCTNAVKLHTTFVDLGYKWLKLADVQNILLDCDLCAQVENHVKPRKSSPGITLSREESCLDVIYIDHKQVIGNSREKTITDNNQDPNWEPDGDLMKSTLTVFEPISGVYWFYPVSGYGTETVKAALRTWFMLSGGSKNVVCDNAPCFTALKDWLKKWYGSELHTTAAYHPNANLAERAHRNFESVLTKYDAVSKEYNFQNWQDNLSLACKTHNSLKNVKYRLSPYEVLLNRTQRDIEPLKFFSHW